jgi:elongation factor P
MKAKYFKVGDFVKINGEIWRILKIVHTHKGRGKAEMELHLKNLKNNNFITKIINPEEDLEELEIEKRPIKFLYSKKDKFYFVDENNKKYEMSIEELGDKSKFIKKDLDITGIFYENNLINIELPIKAVYKVIYAPPGLKGDSEKSNYKIVTIETGAEISVPLFIKEGELIVINTEKGEYVERAKENSQ